MRKNEERKENVKPENKAYFRRVSKEMKKIHKDLDKNVSLKILDEEALNKFEVTITPLEGLWEFGTFVFHIKIEDDYPIAAPKVKCLTKVYHPNIDYKGNVCLNILKDEWSPILSIKHVILGLMFLFTGPNWEDPLNLTAAKVGRENMKQFEINVKKSFNGEKVDGQFFPKMELNKL